MKKNIFPLLMLLTCSISCKKSYVTPSSSDLISRTWQLTGETVNGVEVLAYLDDCSKDNKYIFTKDGKFTEDEGATKCSPTDPQTDTGIYSLLQNNSALHVALPDTTFTVAVSQLTSATLKLTYIVNTGGQNFTLVSTFSAQ